MLKRTLIAAATAVAVAGGALTATAPAVAAPAGYVEIGHWKGPGHWKGRGDWRGHRKWRKGRHFRRSCGPVIRWRWVGRRHGHWQKVVVGWNCKSGRRHHRRWH